MDQSFIEHLAATLVWAGFGLYFGFALWTLDDNPNADPNKYLAIGILAGPLMGVAYIYQYLRKKFGRRD